MLESPCVSAMLKLAACHLKTLLESPMLCDVQALWPLRFADKMRNTHATSPALQQGHCTSQEGTYGTYAASDALEHSSPCQSTCTRPSGQAESDGRPEGFRKLASPHMCVWPMKGANGCTESPTCIKAIYVREHDMALIQRAPASIAGAFGPNRCTETQA